MKFRDPGNIVAASGFSFAKFNASKIGKIVKPLAIAGTVASTGVSICKDIYNGTSRNTIQKCVGIAASYGGTVGGM